MGSIITRAKKLRIKRFTMQAAALVLLNLQFLNIWWPNLVLSGMRGVCSPVFFCHSCPWATTACPLGVLINFSTLKIFPFITLGILVLVGTLGGRIICGWLCPFGLLQDLLFKIRGRKFQVPRQLTYVKYVVLVVMVLAVPYFLPEKPYTFCDVCPSGTLESTIPWAVIGKWDVESGVFGGFTVRFFTRISILVGVLALAVFVSRGFCRTLCPLGAIFGLFNRFSLWRFNLTYEKCNNCSACRKVCPVDIDPAGEINDPECIRCYECTNTKHIKMGVK